MIYVPDLEQYKCVYLKDKDTIRAYKKMPSWNSTSEYTDYYVNSHYLYNEGTQEWGNSSAYSKLPTCLSAEKLTDVVSYRNDFADIMIIFTLMLFIILYLVSKIYKIGFRGFRRY